MSMEKQERQLWTNCLALSRQLVRGIIPFPLQTPLENPVPNEVKLPDELWQDFEQSFKKLRRKLYLKNYHREYSKRNHRKSIFLNTKEVRFLEKEAKKHKKRFSNFLKEIILNYCHQRHRYIVPDEEQLQEVCLEIRRIGNNINQIARYTNHFRALSLFDAQKVRKDLKELEEFIYHTLKLPPICPKCYDDSKNNEMEGLQNQKTDLLFGKRNPKK